MKKSVSPAKGFEVFTGLESSYKILKRRFLVTFVHSFSVLLLSKNLYTSGKYQGANMTVVPVIDLTNQAGDPNGGLSEERARSAQEKELTAALSALLDTAGCLASFMHARYPDEDAHAFRRAHYAAQRAQGEARDLLRHLDVRVTK